MEKIVTYYPYNADPYECSICKDKQKEIQKVMLIIKGNAGKSVCTNCIKIMIKELQKIDEDLDEKQPL